MIANLLVLLAALILLSARPATASARTGRQLAAAVRGTGWARCAGRTVWAVTVVVLLVLASVGAGTGRAVYAAAYAVGLVGVGLAGLAVAREVGA
ncbi:hypothetical protein [Herbidospora daliensis]|uniref:hypothetical protein n=1 Tax=Herbidospora daliensis TaxID=295585 RepID=UPI000780E676|nr:hypothetical protein [Herbidospora daliensis]